MKLMRDILDAFVQGAKETPVGFFSPVVGLWRMLFAQTDRAIAEHRRQV